MDIPIQLMMVEILQFLLQSELIHLSVKMDMQLKLRFGVMDLLVMDVALNPLIQDFCLFVSLPSDFNSLVTFLTLFSRYCIKLIYEVQKRVSLCISATFCTSFQKVIQNTLFITQNNIIYSGILKY